MLDCLKDGYSKLAYILEVNSLKGFSNEKVLKVINDSKKPITKSDIEEILINLSRTTIEKSLGELVSLKQIQIIQKGKYTKYYKI